MAWQQQYGYGYGQQPPLPPQNRLYAQPTGYPLAPQPTGFYPGQQGSYGAPPPVPPPPSLPPAPRAPQLPPAPPQQQYLAPRPSYGIQAQPTGFNSPQQTGYNPSGYGAPLGGGMSQGMQMPSLFTSVFMPANTSSAQQAYGGQMQFSQPAALGGQSLQQTFQHANVQQHGQAELRVPWALSAEERKNYDQIFRAWDQQGSGFVSGSMAKEVFGQSGIDRDDLMKIWNLADVENRGKLNLAEFHVAMGLIYRRINGNPIPDQLPPELVPPSQRDLGTSVDFVKDLLRSDTNQRATASPDRFPDVDRLGQDPGPDYRRARSLHGAAPAATRKDAAIYRHDDNAEPRTYRPSARHLDRRNVRYSGDNDSPASDLDDMRRQLDQSQDLLDRGKTREAEEDALQEEKDDLVHRIRQLQADIQHNSSGRRTEAKEAERRRLDRELDDLRYHRLPDLERKLESHRRETDQQRRETARRRDESNLGSRFDESRGSQDRSAERRREDRDDRGSRGYLRGSYDVDEDTDGYRQRDGEPRSEASPMRRSRSDDSRGDASTPSRPSSRPVAPVPKADPPRPPPTPSSPAPAPVPSATSAEDRKERIRLEAAKRVQNALAKFGVPSLTSTATDPSVEQRLEQDRKEAAQRAAQADQELAERERQRQLRLETERLKDIDAHEASLRRADAAVKEMGDAVTADASSRPSQSHSAVTDATRDELVKAADELREQEAALQREKQARQERLRRLQAEVEEAKRQEEEAEQSFQRNRSVFAATAKPAAASTPPTPAMQPPRASRAPPPAPPSARKPPPTPAARSAPIAPPVSRSPAPSASPATPSIVDSAPVRAPSPPPAPLPPTLSTAPTLASVTAGSTNPFHKMQAQAPSANLEVANGANPFRRPSSASSPSVAAGHAAIPRPPSPPRPSEDWDVGSKADSSDDSSDDEAPATRRDRAGLASALFGTIMPSISRPSSAAATPSQSPVVANSVPSATPPPRPPVAPERGDNVSPVDGPPRNALLQQIQGGASLRRTKVNDRSTPAAVGRIIGGDDPAPATAQPAQSQAKPRDEEEQQHLRAPTDGKRDNRHSVDWYSTMATHSLHGAASSERPPPVDSSRPEASSAPSLPIIPENVDTSQTWRMRTLYPYLNPADPAHLILEADALIEARPATDNDDWLYGTLQVSGASGWLPAAYVARLESPCRAQALYDYSPGSESEGALEAGRTYDIIDRSDNDWWRIEAGGCVRMVPAAYLEVESGAEASHTKLLCEPEGEAAPHAIARLATDFDSSANDASDDDDEEDSADRELQRRRVLEAAGLLVQTPARHARRAPPPRPRASASSRSVEGSTAPSRSGSPELRIDDPAGRSSFADDAYERYIQLQRDLPPVPVATQVTSVPSSTLLSPAPTSRPTPEPASAPSFLSWVASGLSRSTPSPSLATSSSTPVVKRIDHGSPATQLGGRSWASLINEDALEAIPEIERKRQEAIFELIQTEAAYLSSLQQLVGTFFAALQPIVPDRTAEVLFSNVEQLLLSNTSFYSDLEDRQRESRLFVDRIGDVVFRYAQHLDLFRVYCANQGNASKVLSDLKEHDERVASVLQRIRVNDLELEHFLLQPMQRLTRYPLLFNQILKYSDERHEEDRLDLTEAARLAEDVLRATNEAIRRQESDAKLRLLSETIILPGAGSSMGIDLTAPSRTMGTRMLLKEGGFTRGRTSKRIAAYLLNDMLLLTQTTADGEAVFKDPIPLEEISVREGRDELVVVIGHRGRSEKLRAPTARQAMAWVRDLRAAADEVRRAIQRTRGGH